MCWSRVISSRPAIVHPPHLRLLNTNIRSRFPACNANLVRRIFAPSGSTLAHQPRTNQYPNKTGSTKTGRKEVF
nr:MAG TPA: hypothetical protein [Bacteriophage sp.]